LVLAGACIVSEKRSSRFFCWGGAAVDLLFLLYPYQLMVSPNYMILGIGKCCKRIALCSVLWLLRLLFGKDEACWSGF